MIENKELQQLIQDSKDLRDLRNRNFSAAIQFLQGSVEVDNYGQIVIYTGLMFDKQENVVPWSDEEDTDE